MSLAFTPRERALIRRLRTPSAVHRFHGLSEGVRRNRPSRSRRVRLAAIRAQRVEGRALPLERAAPADPVLAAPRRPRPREVLHVSPRASGKEANLLRAAELDSD